MKKLLKLLNLQEDKLTEEQKLLLNQRVQQKMEKSKNQSQYVHKLLVLYKTWNGPAISVEELELISTLRFCRENSQITELTYYKHTHHSENIADPSLFKLNKISHEERLSNLCILLNCQSTSFTTLPKNKDALQVLQNRNQIPNNQ